MREIRRRTRVVDAFPDGNSALMPVAARLCHIAGTRWGLRKSLDLDLLRESALERKQAASKRARREEIEMQIRWRINLRKGETILTRPVKPNVNLLKDKKLARCGSAPGGASIDSRLPSSIRRQAGKLTLTEPDLEA